MQRLTLHEATPKIKAYCAYQERCHNEVKQKLYGYGLYTREVDQLMAMLIEENYLNEERFARMFAGGKFRMKAWGRIKITQELKRRKISPYLIRVAMKEIDPDVYQQRLSQLAEKKWASLKGKKIEKTAKTTQFLMQKGFELPLIQSTLTAMQEEA